MPDIKRISSKSGTRYIDIIQSKEGSYTFQQYVIKYDREEECDYVVRELPDPNGVYGDLSSAVAEAKRLMAITN